MPIADVNGIQITYETFGDPADPSLLLIMGLGAQMVGWDDEVCHMLQDRGFHVIRFDNRDVGESTWIETPGLDVPAALIGALGGDVSTAPYTLSDMAADAIGLLDELGVDRAHLVGASMGGMIAQTIAIEHPERVATLTSIMSTTGEVTVGQPSDEVILALLVDRPSDPEGSIDFGVNVLRTISSPEHFNEERARQRTKREVVRGINPKAVPHQLLAVFASGSRAEGLAQLDVPTLVIHGLQDQLVNPSGGERTAELVPGAELVLIEDMAHDLPEVHVPAVIARVTALTHKAV